MSVKGIRTAYHVIITDKDDNELATLENVAPPSWVRSKNTADQFTIELPRSDAKISHVNLNNKIQIHRGSNRVATGYIVNRAHTDDKFEITCFTEEILMSRYRTPSGYGYPLTSEYNNLSSFANTIIRGWNWIGLKWDSDWTTYQVEANQTTHLANPGWITLTDPAVSQSGTFTVRFDKTTHFGYPDQSQFLEWDRFRWSADYVDGGVTVQVAYRDSDGGEGGAFGTKFSGALTETVGFQITNGDAQWVEFRFYLESPNTTDTPVIFGAEIIARTVTPVAIGTIHADASSVTVPEVTADYRTALEVMTDVFDLTGWEFKVESAPGTSPSLSIAPALGTDKSDDIILVVE